MMTVLADWCGPSEETKDWVTLTFAKYAPGSAFELMLSGIDMKPRGSVLRYRYLPAGNWVDQENALFGTNLQGVTTWQMSSGLMTEDQGKRLSTTTGSRLRQVRGGSGPTMLTTVDALEVSRGMTRSFVLSAGNLVEPFAARYLPRRSGTDLGI